MAERSCTVQEASAEKAAELGANELGVPAADVEAVETEPGHFRVSVTRAPSTVVIDLMSGEMEAIVTLITPPIGDAPPPTRDDVLRALEQAGASGGTPTEDADATAGVLLAEIDKLVAEVAAQGVERRNVVVARGQAPIPGAAGRTTRHYLRPTEDDPDRRQRIVRHGEVLIEQDAPTPGTPGFTLRGETLPAGGGAREAVEVGSGITVDKGEGRWTVGVRAFGYLELDAEGRPAVRPAITVSEDSLHAYIHLLGPTGGEPPLTWAEVEAAVPEAGITHGVLADRLATAWHAFEERGDLPRPIRIADGTPPERGRDAGIEFAIDVSQSIGEVAEDTEQIDYRDRHAVHNVAAGQPLGTWHPAGAGVAGRGVDGATLPAEAGADGTLNVLENVESQEHEDGTITLSATIDGMVVVQPGNTISVIDALQIRGDVDLGTGHIDAVGSVLVSGTVRQGFRVTAKRDITVRESIEDAVVEAGGELLVRQGIIGGKDGRIIAGARVTANYAQGARIACGGDVEIRDSDSNSVIECAGRLVATAGYGRLMGGRYIAAQGLTAQVLGSDFGAPTSVSVGDDPVIARHMRDLTQQLSEVRAKVKKIDSGLDGDQLKRLHDTGMSPTQAAALRSLLEERKELAERDAALQAERDALAAEAHQGDPPTVEVTATVYSGVDIYIRGYKYHADDILGPTRFHLDIETGEVVAGPLQ